jgi:hypothetical protein
MGDRGPNTSGRRSHPGLQGRTAGHPAGPGHAELLTDLVDARRTEHAAATSLMKAREELVAAVVHARAKGFGFDRLAQASLRALRGQTITLVDREREAARFRKLVQRRHRDKSHGFLSREIEDATPSAARSMAKEKDTMEKLIKRRTIEETFAVEETGRGLAADERDDDIDDVNDGDHEDNEPPRTAGRRR